MTTVVAHRGDPVAHWENTIPAFVAAEEQGVDMLELDVQLSRDGRCIILHDRTLERLWNAPARVRDLTCDEIRRATSAAPYDIPELQEVVCATRAQLMIDIEDEDVVEGIAQTLVEHDAVSRSVLVGGNLAAHRRMRQLLPELRHGLSWGRRELPTDDILDELRFTWWNPGWWLIADWDHRKYGSTCIRRMHERGTLVSTWTVDDVDTALALVDAGVDMIISNRAGEVKQALANRLDATTFANDCGRDRLEETAQ
ncbi:MAG: glycerophosphodiester phosphodiesterase [Firmicutes bacterium]|nr:glycerophosphodiester phosphodiesterase [Bacillota bacterium]